MSSKPVLYLFSGLPGSGKSTLAQRVVQRVHAAYVRIDSIEQALRDFCSIEVAGEGYGLAYRIAGANLRLGISVVADSCNPIELTRRAWEQLAHETLARYVNIEVVCSDVREHRRRVESRESTVPGLKLPTWSEVENREYDKWLADRIVVDTSKKSEADCFDELVSSLLRDEA